MRNRPLLGPAKAAMISSNEVGLNSRAYQSRASRITGSRRSSYSLISRLALSTGELTVLVLSSGGRGDGLRWYHRLPRVLGRYEQRKGDLGREDAAFLVTAPAHQRQALRDLVFHGDQF